MTPADPRAPAGYPVRARVDRFTGAIFQIVTDTVEMPDGDLADRDYLRHPGSVAVVPYHEPADEVVLVRQYRHPVGRHLWELPAGLVDHDGETLPQVAHRELAEEAGLACGRLDLLVDLHTSPGCSDEWIRVFLARDLAPTTTTHARRHEEATMTVARFRLADAVRMVLAGRLTNATAVAGLLAAARARELGWAPLRPLDEPAPAPE
jgi:ADP-ribose pyrophosphatase